MKKYLVTTDGSENSKKALLEAKKLGEYVNADITIMHVAKDLNINPYGTIEHSKLFTKTDEKASKKFVKEVLKDNVNSAEALLKDALALFDGYPGGVDIFLERGNPSEKILEKAELGDYDLIIMGSRGLGTFSRAMLGSISNKVLNHAKTDVLIIK